MPSADLDAPPRLDRGGHPVNRGLQEALTNLELQAGGRVALIETLATTSDLDGDELRFVQLLSDPRHGNKSLSRLCSLSNMSFNKVVLLFRRAKGAQAYFEALEKVYNKLPLVAEDVMTRSLPHQKICPSCYGFKRRNIRHEGEERVEDCETCQATGRVEAEPDLDRQKLALQMGNLIKQGGGVQVNTQVYTQVNGGGGPLRSTVDFRTATDRLLFPGRTREIPLPSEEVGEGGVGPPAEEVS